MTLTFQSALSQGGKCPSSSLYPYRYVRSSRFTGDAVTGLSEGLECLYQHDQAVQEEYLTMMKGLESFKTSEATLKNYMSHVPED